MYLEYYFNKRNTKKMKKLPRKEAQWQDKIAAKAKTVVMYDAKIWQ